MAGRAGPVAGRAWLYCRVRVRGSGQLEKGQRSEIVQFENGELRPGRANEQFRYELNSEAPLKDVFCTPPSHSGLQGKLINENKLNYLSLASLAVADRAGTPGGGVIYSWLSNEA